MLETYPLSPINVHWPAEPFSASTLDNTNGDSQPIRQLLHLEFTNLVPPAAEKVPEPGKSDEVDMADLFEAKPEEEDSILQLIVSFGEFKDCASSLETLRGAKLTYQASLLAATVNFEAMATSAIYSRRTRGDWLSYGPRGP